MNRMLKIAVIQLKNYIGEGNKSFAAAEQLIRQAAAEGAKPFLIVSKLRISILC